jgi:hypothetical protein
LKGKMKPENPISHGENHGFQLSDSLQQSEQIWKLWMEIDTLFFLDNLITSDNNG